MQIDGFLMRRLKCLLSFKECLQNIKNPVLVGHNIDNFDAIRLFSETYHLMLSTKGFIIDM